MNVAILRKSPYSAEAVDFMILISAVIGFYQDILSGAEQG